MTNERKPRILHLTHHFAPCIGGVETVVGELCSRLAKDGFVSDVACLDRCANSNKKLKSEESMDGTRVYRVPFVDLKYYKLAPSVYRLFRNYDVLHVHGLGFFSDLALLTKPLHKKPVVLSTHGGIAHTKKISLLKNIYFNLWARLLLRNADAVCACSKADGEMFKRISSRVVIVENGVNIEPLLKLNVRKEPGTFLYVGRLSANKRIELLLGAFAAAKEKLGNFRLSIVGEDWGGLMPELKKRADGLGIGENVEFTGALTGAELLRRYEKAMFFVSASRHEGFGISAVEAMAAGCVPILSRIPTFERFVKGGKAGFIVDFEKPKDAGRRIAEITKMGEKELSATAAEARRESGNYGWGGRIREFEKIYGNAAKR